MKLPSCEKQITWRKICL